MTTRCTDCGGGVAGPHWLRCFEHAYQRARALLSPVPLIASSIAARRFCTQDRVLVAPREKERERRGLAIGSVLAGSVVRVKNGVEYVIQLDAGGRYYAGVTELRACPGAESVHAL
jgi:hypothetical protein